MNKGKSEVRYELKCGKEGEVGACRVLEKKRKGGKERQKKVIKRKEMEREFKRWNL